MRDRVVATDDPPVAEPFAVTGIRNFGWVIPGLLARGEQPTLEAATFDSLRDLGIRSVLSLRPDREPPPRVNLRKWAEYRIEDEQRLVEQSGLRFRHVPLVDFSAPMPHQIAAALEVIDSAVADSAAVYVHCRAGAGRAGLVCGAWSVTHGRSGDHAAAAYERFMQYVATVSEMAPQDRPAMYRRVGQPYVWWALREIAHALGSPVTREPASLLPPERPPEADSWQQGYWDALQPWRERRAGTPP
jgi:protein tyrosine phosphatase (PTP) superfamily phosphohydrolase (DUF442 family)